MMDGENKIKLDCVGVALAGQVQSEKTNSASILKIRSVGVEMYF